MKDFREATAEEEREEELNYLIEQMRESSDPDLPRSITVRLPRGMTEEDLLKGIKALSKSPKTPEKKVPKCGTCLHLQIPNNYCRLYSSDCATAVLNHRTPPRYTPKEVQPTNVQR